jgi:hypothetical protein
MDFLLALVQPSRSNIRWRVWMSALHLRRIAMKRKFMGMALFFAIVCAMGADSIAWDATQPMPNPGGKALTLEGKGPYEVDPANDFTGVTFWTPTRWGPEAERRQCQEREVGLHGRYSCCGEIRVLGRTDDMG